MKLEKEQQEMSLLYTQTQLISKENHKLQFNTSCHKRLQT